MWLPHAKTMFYCDLESHAIILWCVISVELNTGKKTTGLEMMILNRESCFQTYRTDVYELHCLQECFRKQTGREDV